MKEDDLEGLLSDTEIAEKIRKFFSQAKRFIGKPTLLPAGGGETDGITHVVIEHQGANYMLVPVDDALSTEFVEDTLREEGDIFIHVNKLEISKPVLN